MSSLNGLEEETEESPLLSNNVTIISLPSRIEKIRKPHVLWMLIFSITLSSILTSTTAPLVRFVLDIVCLEYYDDKNIDNTLTPPSEEDCKITEISALASKYLMWYQMFSYLAATLSIGFLSTLSDYHGRRFIFRLATLGVIISFSNVIFVYHYWRIVSVKFLFVGAIFEGLSGGVIAINTACHAYLSDCTRPENRSLVFGIMHAFAFCGMTIGPTLGGVIVKSTNSVISVFYFVVCALLFFLVFVSFILPESLSKELRHQRRVSSPVSSISPRHLFSSLTILKQEPVNYDEEERRNSWSSRNTMYILSVIYLIYRLSQAGQNDIITLYTTQRFNWSTLENGFFLSLQAFTRFIALILLLPLCRLLQTKYLSSYSHSLDIHMTRAGLIMEIVGFALFASAIVPNMLYFACVINSLATIATPAIRSLFTMYVLPTQAGQVLGALSVIESVGSIFSPLWMNPLYSWSVRKGFSEIVFWANSLLFVIASFLAFLIR
ncbi:hypothetical protein Glove_277g40 [Diversispora epigaea]|uniref:Major facilitator superfamily (MFS) profile domain-containing protein n=1 Tax=Diversispora epigaea TaxID=1348612 RepID=A0A397I2K0_9GLOM|nr:hypothetical protein Glove_277g40 [Diversispora epigaea]